MKIILLKDTSGIGKKYDVKDVSDGFARNRLIPCGDAEMATPKALASILARKERVADTKRLERSLLEKNIASVHEKMVVLVRKANEKGHLFAKIKAENIVSAIRENLQVEIPSSAIVLEKNIETIGIHRILFTQGTVRAEILLDVRVE
ncbi:MAG: 50S ribosomal protein L9 [Patescibacteria group bacterium]